MNKLSLTITLLILTAISPVISQSTITIGTPSSDFTTGSPLVISAYPTATAAADNNTPGPDAPQGAAFKYFMTIWLENQDFDTVANLDEFQWIAKQGIVLNNFNALTHPSLPNYIAAVSGSNWGIIDDGYYDIPSSVPTIFDLLEQKGLTWKAYNENLIAPGWTGYESDDGLYVRKHNPAIIFDSIGLNQTRSANVVPAENFLSDIAGDDMPSYSFYTPNINNDAHDTDANYGGQWLGNFLANDVMDTPFYQNALVLITFDETASYDTRNRVWACLIGGVIPENLRGSEDSTFYTHYSALNTVELNWGLDNLGVGDTDPFSSNVFDFLASSLGYTNQDIPSDAIPYNNTAITGMLTNCSYNDTSDPNYTTGDCGITVLTN